MMMHRCPANAVEGFVSAAAIFALAIIGAVVTGGYLTSRQQFRAGWIGLQANAALYSAEAGLNVALANWSRARVEGLEPGAAILLESGRLVSGDDYKVQVTRLDHGQDRRTAYYLISSVGHASGPYGGRRRVGLVASARQFDDLCCPAALSARGGIQVSGGSEISGLDIMPLGWTSPHDHCRDITVGDKPAISVDDAGLASQSEGGRIVGDPPIAETERGYTELTYEELVAYADLEYPGGVTVTHTEPVMGEDGECARGSPNNWGAPLDQSHPCFDYFPIIHVAGDLVLNSTGNGQGVLLVDGNFDLRGGYEFYGIVVVRGAIRAEGAAGRIYGGAIVINAEGASSLISGDALIQRSACAIHWATSQSGLGAPRPLAQRGWLELLK